MLLSPSFHSWGQSLVFLDLQTQHFSLCSVFPSPCPLCLWMSSFFCYLEGHLSLDLVPTLTHEDLIHIGIFSFFVSVKILISQKFTFRDSKWIYLLGDSVQLTTKHAGSWIVTPSTLMGFPGCSDNKESVWNAGDPGSVPGFGRSPGEGNGNPLHYSCLENSMDREAWQGERPQKKRNLLIPWSWTSSLQNFEEKNFCCLSHPVCGIWLWPH